VSLISLVQDVKDDLNAHGFFPDVRLGKDVPAQEGDPVQGRVVFWPKEFEYKATERRVGGNPRAMAVRHQELEIRVWGRAPNQIDPSTQFGQDFEAASTLADATVAAMIREWTFGSLTLDRGFPEDETRTEVFGVELVFRATVWIPVLDQSWPTVQVAQSDTDKMRFPSGDHTANPSA
jgi:hypothetical protein